MRNRISEAPTSWRPVAYVTLADRACREQIAAVLSSQGWLVVEPATGFHLVQLLSGLITGDEPGLRPGLIVVDAIARGCAGTTISAGLRELGLGIPTVLVTAEPAPVIDRDVVLVDPSTAAAVVGELARPWSRLEPRTQRAAS